MILKLFIVRLAAFINVYSITVCRELGGGFSGICLSEADIEELWRLHYEVNTLFTEYSVFILMYRKPTLVVCRGYFQPKDTVTCTTNIFPMGYQKLMNWLQNGLNYEYLISWLPGRANLLRK